MGTELMAQLPLENMEPRLKLMQLRGEVQEFQDDDYNSGSRIGALLP